MSAQEFASRTLAVVERIQQTQAGVIADVGRAFAETVRDGRDVWVFGTGHSHMIAEEFFGRAGGFASIRAMWEPEMMLHEGELRSSLFEKLTGVAGVILQVSGIRAGDLLIVASNSGINAVPVEIAAGARERGVRVVALTSVTHSDAMVSRAPSGAKLKDLADFVIDNCGVPGDAIVPVGGAMVGATSTVTGAFIAQSIVSEAAALLASWGEPVPILQSNNFRPAEAGGA